jgi:hypothetical protein
MMQIRWLLVMENDDAEDHRQPVDPAGRHRRGAGELALPYFNDELGAAVDAVLSSADTQLPTTMAFIRQNAPLTGRSTSEAPSCCGVLWIVDTKGD